MININKYSEIVEKFSHHIMGKINISNLLIELNHNSKDLLPINEEIVALISLFKEVFVNKSNNKNYYNKIIYLFNKKECNVIINNYTEYIEYKNILMFLLYEVVDNSISIIINNNNIIYQIHNDINMINVIKNHINNEWKNISTELDIITSKYIISDMQVIFNFI